MNQDLISRQGVIEVLSQYPFEKVVNCISIIEEFPSAQPNTSNSSKALSALDCVERQAAIDALDALCDRECEYSKQQRSFMCGACRLGSAFDVIDELPSAQSDGWLSRHRDEILRAGMEGREFEFRIGGRLFAIREKAQ